MQQWYIEDDGLTVAHEAGHMLGNPDEYTENDVCPDRDVLTDNTIMGSGSEVKDRHYERFAIWITNNTDCLYEVQS
jgi:M6 family metalloprotease-like protein